MRYPHSVRRSKKGYIPATTGVFIVILVAIIAFLGGMRAQQYDLFDTIFQKDSIDSSLPNDLSYDSVEEVYDVLRRKFDGPLSQEQILDGIKSGLAQSSEDPYTVYLTADQATQFKDDLNGKFSGIGAEIGEENEVLIIVAPLDGYPAQKAGLRPQDVIIAINGEDSFGLSIEEAVLKIRGEVGTDVVLDVLRTGEQLTFTITREEITVPSVEWEFLAGNIGYMRISRFAEDTTKLARQAAQDFLDNNVSGIIMDVRNNSGGYLNAAVNVAGLWLDKQVVVEQRENSGTIVTDSLRSGSNPLLADIDTIVLINEGSASASEIVAGALQDYQVATLVGQTSFGKGSVQTLEEFLDGSILKVTIARWYSPSGRNIDEDGIEPEHKVEVTEQDYSKERDPQKDKAIELLN